MVDCDALKLNPLLNILMPDSTIQNNVTKGRKASLTVTLLSSRRHALIRSHFFCSFLSVLSKYCGYLTKIFGLIFDNNLTKSAQHGVLESDHIQTKLPLIRADILLSRALKSLKIM
jgi:hypothetical protein